MRVVLQVHEGEDLTVGIKTSCISNDGKQTDETGWFKVDHFTIRRIGDLPQDDTESLTEELIVNSDFEYKSATELANGATVKGIPYGWNLSFSDTYSTTNSGLFGNGEGCTARTIVPSRLPDTSLCPTIFASIKRYLPPSCSRASIA